MKSKSVSSSESEDLDEGVDPDLEDVESEGEDNNHTEDDAPKRPKPVVAAVPAAAALYCSPHLCHAILRPLPSLVRPRHGRRVARGASVCRFLCA